MRHTNRALVALAVLATLWAAVVTGCGGPAGGGPASTPPSSPPVARPADITGVVRDLTPAAGDGALPALLVVADPAVTSSVDRAWVRVTAGTTIWARSADGRRELGADDLSSGQRVAIRFTGPVAESYPVQATAGDIEILSPL